MACEACLGRWWVDCYSANQDYDCLAVVGREAQLDSTESVAGDWRPRIRLTRRRPDTRAPVCRDRWGLAGHLMALPRASSRAMIELDARSRPWASLPRRRERWQARRAVSHGFAIARAIGPK